MKRSWIGVALFSGAWAFGYPLYHDPDHAVFCLFAAAGIAMQFGRCQALSRGSVAVIGALLLIPAIVWFAWPFNVVPILCCAGLLPRALPRRAAGPRLCDRLTSALVCSAGIMGVQGFSLVAFAHATAVAKALPGPIAWLLAALANVAGARAGVAGDGISFFTMRQVHVLAATWQLAIDPVLVAFASGGIALLAMVHLDRRLGWRSLAMESATFVGSLLAWVPLRFCLMQGLFLHRALLVGYDEPLDLMDQYWSPWVFLALLVPPLAFVLCRSWRSCAPSIGAENSASADGGISPAILAAAGAAALFCAGLYWVPPGDRKPGRIAVDEYHSDWERTDRPFDTTWYGQDSTYNYAAIFDYTGRYFDTAQIVEPITPAVLSDTDVLILKIPTRPYEAGEIESILRFVEGGGGLFLVGEHTDVFRSGTFLNAIARRLGVEFRSDSLLHIDSAFSQALVPPRVSHPILQNVPPFRFQVSCSLMPKGGRGRCVIVSRGMRALNADYNMSNYYPEVRDYSDARSGSFVQMWAARHGRGRVVAFTDSTIFSNFSAFEPGVSELWLGAIDWLNRRNDAPDPRPILWALGVVVAATGVSVAAGQRGRGWVLAAAAALCGWSVGGMAVRAAHAAAAPFPAPVRPLVRVTVDRSVSRVPLAEAGFLGNHPDSFGIFEMWILRLGYFTRRASGRGAFGGDLLLILYPERKPSQDYMRRLVEYVRGGGRLLVMDSERNGVSTANELLEPFGLAVERGAAVEGRVAPAADWKGCDGGVAGRGFAVRGGSPVAMVGETPVGACVAFGKGTVVALGCAGIFDDDVMGGYFHATPEGDLLQRWTLEFELVKGLVEDRIRPGAKQGRTPK